MEQKSRGYVRLWQMIAMLLLFILGTIALRSLPYAEKEQYPGLWEAAYYSLGLFLGAGNPVGFPRARSEFARELNRTIHSDLETPDVDLLIRTGGEKRLSDFLLWESAYAELYFTDILWPDFSTDDLLEAIRDFHHRDRRFGKINSLPDSPAGSGQLTISRGGLS